MFLPTSILQLQHYTFVVRSDENPFVLHCMYPAILRVVLWYVLIYLFRFISSSQILTSWLVLPPTVRLIYWQSGFSTVKSSPRSSCYVWTLPPGLGWMCRRRSKTAVTTARWVVSTTFPTWTSSRRTAWSSPHWLPRGGRWGLVNHKHVAQIIPKTMPDTTIHVTHQPWKSFLFPGFIKYCLYCWEPPSCSQLTLFDMQSF